MPTIFLVKSKCKAGKTIMFDNIKTKRATKKDGKNRREWKRPKERERMTGNVEPKQVCIQRLGLIFFTVLSFYDQQSTLLPGHIVDYSWTPTQKFSHSPAACHRFRCILACKASDLYLKYVSLSLCVYNVHYKWKRKFTKPLWIFAMSCIWFEHCYTKRTILHTYTHVHRVRGESESEKRADGNKIGMLNM